MIRALRVLSISFLTIGVFIFVCGIGALSVLYIFSSSSNKYAQGETCGLLGVSHNCKEPIISSLSGLQDYNFTMWVYAGVASSLIGIFLVCIYKTLSPDSPSK